MKVYHVEFAKTGIGLSGGEKCMVEIIRYLKEQSISNVLLTTDNGKRLYEKLGLVEDEFLKYIIINSESGEKKYHIFISYILRVFQFLNIRGEIIKTIDHDEDILMCHSEFFPNTIPSSILTKYFRKNPFYWFHMLAPSIFKGYEGQFTNTFHVPNVRLLHYKLNQILFKYLSKGGFIITVNAYYESYLKGRGSYTLRKFGGENLYIIQKYSGTKFEEQDALGNRKEYDLAFMGRFHPQKGLFELPKILKLVKKKKPDVRLVVIGGGNPEMEKKFLDETKKESLEKNVDYVGFISTDEKFDYLRKAKIFIFPSYYESFGQVALEAMANGLPVVAYDLPTFSVFESGMTKVPTLNNVEFAKEILELLENKEKLQKASSDAFDYASTFSWDRTGKEVYDLILSSK